MYEKTITVFNKYTDQNDNIYWYPHVLTDVDLIIDKAANTAKTGLDAADAANLHIRYDAGTKVNGLPYLPPKEWKSQTNDQLPESITFSPGDIFLLGEYAEDMVTDSDYQTRKDSGFYDYLNKQKDHVYLITTIAMYPLIPHFEIGGK